MSDEQDPLPESSFFYRRIYTYIVSAVILAGIGWIIWSLADALGLLAKNDINITAIANAQRDIAFYLIALALLPLITFYLLAPSGEQLAKIVQAAKITMAKIPGFGGGETEPRRPARHDPYSRVTPDDPEE